MWKTVYTKNCSLTLLHFLAAIICTVTTFAQNCTIDLLPDEEQIVVQYAVDVATCGSQIYIADDGTFDYHLNYIGKYTGSFIGVNMQSGTLISQPSWPKSDGVVLTAIEDGNGGWYLAGEFKRVGDSVRNNLAHINSSGKVSSFNIGTDGPVKTLFLKKNTLYVGGDFNQISNTPRKYIAAIDIKTHQVSSWLLSVNGVVNTIASWSNYIYIGGKFNKVNSLPRQGLAEVDLNTATLTNWVVNFASTLDYVNVVNITSDTLYIGGKFNKVDGNTRSLVASYKLSTHSLLPFRLGAISGVKEALSIAVEANSAYIGMVDLLIAKRIDNLATLWSKISSPLGFTKVYALEIDGNNLYIGGGISSLIKDSLRIGIAALDRFSGKVLPWWPQTHMDIVHIVKKAGNALYLGGGFTSLAGDFKRNIAIYDTLSKTIDSLPVRLSRNFIKNHSAAPKLANILIHDSLLYIAGHFDSVNGQYRKSIASFDLRTKTLTAWAPRLYHQQQLLEYVNTMDIHGDNIYVSGSFSHVNGQPRNCVAAININTGKVISWSPDFEKPLYKNPQYRYYNRFGLFAQDGVISKFLFKDSLIIAIGDFDKVDGYNIENLCMLDSVTGRPINWNPEINGVVLTGNIVGNTLYIGGAFDSVGVQQRFGFSAFDINNKLLLPVKAQIDSSYIADMELVGNTIILTGDTKKVSSGIRSPMISTIDAVSGAQGPIHPNVNYLSDPLMSIHRQSSRVYILGNQDIDNKKFSNLAIYRLQDIFEPKINISQPEYVCAGQQVIISAHTGQVTGNYQWYLNGKAIGSNNSTFNFVPKEGDSVQCYFVNTATPCYSSKTGKSNILHIKLIELPDSVGQVVCSRESVCLGDTINFEYKRVSKKGTPTNYHWIIPTGSQILMQTDTTLTLRFQNSGNLNVILSIAYNKCDTFFVKREIEVKPLPSLMLQHKKDVCKNERVTVFATNNPPTSAYTYTWVAKEGLILDSLGRECIVVWKDTGQHLIFLYASVNGCSSGFKSTINVHTDPQVQIDKGNEIKVCNNEITNLSIRETFPGYSYNWSPANLFSESDIGKTVSTIFKNDTTVHVRAMSQYGCVASDSISVRVEGCCSVYLPDAFTPNGDGRNDEFRLIRRGLHDIHVFQIRNRWGIKVFETNDEMHGWDGNYKGQAADVGTYYYVLKYSCGGEVMEQQGDLQLIR